MADEVTDTSNGEQLVVCMRWFDKEFQAHEDFIGLYKLDTLAATEIVAILKDTLLRLNLNIHDC